MKKVISLTLLGSALLLASCNQEPLPSLSDTTAPTISLEASPTTLTTSGNVILKATVSDDKGVARVSFYRGNTLLSTDQTAPFEATDAVAVQAGGQVSYRAVAEDEAGNKAEAKRDVTLSVGEIVGTVVEGQPQPGADGTSTVALKPWTGGGGTVKLTLSSARNSGASADTPLAADGSFRLSLPIPDTAELPLIGSFSCPNDVKASDPQARAAYGFLSVYASKTGTIRPLKLIAASASGSTVETGQLIYVDRSVTLDGTSECSFFADSFKKLTLQAGWNKVHVVVQYGNDGSRRYTYSNAAFVDNWVFLN